MGKRLCGCGCGKQVSRKTELRHQNGQGSALLASETLALNHSLIHSRKWDSQTQRKKSSQLSLKQQVVGHPASVRHAVSSMKCPASNPATDEVFDEPADDDLPKDVDNLAYTWEDNVDFLMGEAGPSGVNHDSPELFSPRDDVDFLIGEAGPSGVNYGSPEPFLPPSSPPPKDNAVNPDDYGLSNLRRSRRIADCVDRIGLQRWGTNHVWQFIIDEEESGEEDEGTQVTEDLADGVEDWLSGDEDVQEDDEDVMPSAEPGQEGVSVWDLLGESFLKEVSELGVSASTHFLTDV
jgi:hypothetical protein